MDDPVRQMGYEREGQCQVQINLHCVLSIVNLLLNYSSTEYWSIVLCNGGMHCVYVYINHGQEGYTTDIPPDVKDFMGVFRLRGIFPDSNR